MNSSMKCYLILMSETFLVQCQCLSVGIRSAAIHCCGSLFTFKKAGLSQKTQYLTSKTGSNNCSYNSTLSTSYIGPQLMQRPEERISSQCRPTRSLTLITDHVCTSSSSLISNKF